MTTEGTTDVIVVGAGPVGQVLALLLAEWDMRTTLVERWPDVYPLPRAVALSHEARRTLEAVGFSDTDLLEAWGGAGKEFSFQSATGEVLLRMEYNSTSSSGYAEMYAFSQPKLELALAALVEKEPRIAVLRGFSVTEVRQNESGVEAVIVEHDGDNAVPGGEQRLLTAPFLAGCDGANSTVRQCIGSQMVDDGFSQRWLVIDVEPKEPWPHAYGAQVLDPTRPTTLISGGPDQRRFEFMLMEDEPSEAMDTDATAWDLMSRWGVRPDNARLVRHATYEFASRLADTWVSGRVALAGDAAHQMPPFLGQGFNSGIRDAANLAWRLARRGDTGRADLLRDYEVERSRQLREILNEAVSVGQLICETDPARAEARDERLRRRAHEVRSARTEWPLGEGTARWPDVGAGSLSTQAPVSASGKRDLFDAVLGGVGPVLVLAPGTTPGRFEDDLTSAWAAVGGRTSGVTPSPGGVVVDVEVDDVTGALTEWLDDLRASAALVRPDYYVYGVAVSPEDIPALVADYLADVGAYPATTADAP